MIVDLKNRTKPNKGWIISYEFENKNIGLAKTRFYKFIISLEPFNSGFEWVEQPEDTEICLDWFKLDIHDFSELDGMILCSDNYPDAEGSLYLGGAHNWCHVNELRLKQLEDANTFEVYADLNIEFENEGVGDNERYIIQTDLSVRV
jgi:hypothetical protein